MNTRWRKLVGREKTLSSRRDRASNHRADGVVPRDVKDGDLPAFFTNQLYPEANRRAGFEARDIGAFIAHWRGIMDDETVTKTILLGGNVAGNIVSLGPPEEREVGYWLGREYRGRDWGGGVATRALFAFLDHEKTRPLHARLTRHNTASLRVLERCGFDLSGEDVEGFILELEA